MPPKKRARTTRKSTEKQRSVPQEKAHLNMPCKIKVTIPLRGAEKQGIYFPILRGGRPPLYTRHLDVKTKIELANSVARQQLVKEEPPGFQLDNVVVINSPIVRGVERGRKRKSNEEVVSDFFLQRVHTENNPTEISPKAIPPKENAPEVKPTPPRKIFTRKRLANLKAKKKENCEKSEPTATKTIDHKIKLEDIALAVNSTVETEPEPMREEQPEVVKTMTQPETKTVQSQPKKRKPIIKRLQPTDKQPPANRPPELKRKRGRPKGKQQNVQPSIDALFKKQVAETDEQLTTNKPTLPALVETRKDSVGSISNQSWTRDISSSSNNTCVGSVSSSDFVRINKKLPVLKLRKINNKLTNRQNEALEAVSAVVEKPEEQLTDSYDSDSSITRERKFSDQFNDSLGVNSLHLSTSSSAQFANIPRKDSIADYSKTTNILSQSMEEVDQEIIKWMGSECDDITVSLIKFRDKMFNIFDREFGIITNCRSCKNELQKIDETSIAEHIQNCDANDGIERPLVELFPPREATFPVKEAISVKDNALVEKNTKELENEFVKPSNIPSKRLSTNAGGNFSTASARTSKDAPSDDEAAAGTSYDHHDDDDTLSLFAESITGFESSRMNTSTAPVVVSKPPAVEEYIPKPVKPLNIPNIEKQTYCPTKIREDAQLIASKVSTVCEKQNADSTSIYKQSISTDDAESYKDLTEEISFGSLDTSFYLDTRLVSAQDVIKKPQLMDSYFEGIPKPRSVVFGNLCFYNLLNCCRNYFTGTCRFVHLTPTSENIKEKLNNLDDRTFIQEYLLMRRWKELRINYGMCFVEECAKRGHTRVLVEMAYDFIVKGRDDSKEDTQLRINTIEITLLHLNTVDLSICEDLLNLTIRVDQESTTLLCDVFMETMPQTANFSRFKVVFLNLTYFIVNNDRTFKKDVVEQFLERVCILPFDVSLARALIQMMRLTKADIFNHSMIGHFEKQICGNKHVLEEYTLLKRQCAVSSAPEAPAASPDTTNLDNMQNKTTVELSQPLITRTIGMNPPIVNVKATSATAPRAFVVPGSSNAFPSPSTSFDSSIPSTSLVNTDSETSELNNWKWRDRMICPHSDPLPMVKEGPTHSSSIRGTPTRGTAIRGTRGNRMRGFMRPPNRFHTRPPMRVPYNHRLVVFRSPANYVSRQSRPNY